MPHFPQNFTQTASVPTPRNLAPIAETPAFGAIEEAHNPGALFLELHQAIVVRAQGRYLMSSNSVEEDDFPSGALLVCVPPFLPRPISATTEPVDTSPLHSPTLEALTRRTDRPGGPIDASAPPPLERHGGNFPPQQENQHHAGARAQHWTTTMNDMTPQSVYNSALGSPMPNVITVPAPGFFLPIDTLLSSNPGGPRHTSFLPGVTPPHIPDMRAAHDSQAMGVTPPHHATAHVAGSAFASFLSNIPPALAYFHGSGSALPLQLLSQMNDGTPQAIDPCTVGSPMLAQTPDAITLSVSSPDGHFAFDITVELTPPHISDRMAATPTAAPRAANDPQAMGVTPLGEDDSDDAVGLLGATDHRPFLSE